MTMWQQLIKYSVILSFAVCINSCQGQTREIPIRSSGPASSQQRPAHKRLVKTQGSTEADNVNNAMEDKAGNLWFGTTGEGLFKFDGDYFVQFTTTDGLASNTVYSLYESKDGNIWVGTSNGLSIYNGHSFKTVFIAPTIHSLHNKFYVFDIMEDASGKLWIATVEGIFIYDGQNYVPFTVSETGNGYISTKHNTEYLLQDTADHIWFGSRVNDGVFCYDGDTIVNFKLSELSGHQWAWPALQDKRGYIWLSNWGGTYRYDGTSFATFTQEDGLASQMITRIITDKNGHIWFGGNAGVSRFDGQSFTHFSTKDGLPHNGVWSILEDQKGNIWIGTRNTGLCRYDGRVFTNFSAEEGVQIIEE